MHLPTRTFIDSRAQRAQVPLLLGLVGPSGSGKTYSALSLATGIQSLVGGEIFCIDTEAKRALHYAEQFRFRHVPFDAPFGPLDYLVAVQHCADKGAKTVIVDSLSHEHEGPGGVLEMHEAELDRLAGNDYKKRERVTLLAWQRPKAERRRLINTILQLDLNLICCFRAKEKVKPLRVAGETKIVEMGFMAIAGEEFLYEMTANCLLLPRSNGVPTWESEQLGERAAMKLPNYLAHAFEPDQALSEETGRRLAAWTQGPVKPGDAVTSTRASALGAAMADDYIAYAKEVISEASDAPTLAAWWNSPEQKQQRKISGITQSQYESLKALVMARMKRPSASAPADAPASGLLAEAFEEEQK